MSELFLITATQNKGILSLYSIVEFAKRLSFFISPCLRDNDH